MPRPLFSQFIIENTKLPALKNLSIADRGKYLGELYRKLGAAEKAALAKRAASAASFKRVKVASSVRRTGRRMGIPAEAVKKHWHTLSGGSVVARLRQLAAQLNIKVRKPRGSKSSKSVLPSKTTKSSPTKPSPTKPGLTKPSLADPTPAKLIPTMKSY